jgi:hypothetical protein
MKQFLIERHFGPVTDEQLQAGAVVAIRVASDQFPQLAWEHSHAAQGDDGVITYCVYTAPDEAIIRNHARAAGLPCNRISEIQTVSPADFASTS